MNPRIWSILHDGSIESITGSVPGDLRFAVDLEYLRRQFANPGSKFIIQVLGCTKLTFESFKNDAPINEIDEILRNNLDLLTATQNQNELEIMTESGILRLVYNSERLLLEDGSEVSYEAVQDAAQRAID